MTNHQKPIVVVGSINIDLVAAAPRIPAPGETLTGTEFRIHPGGKGANQAVAVGRLGYPVFMIGRVGSDPFGGQLRANLINAGVDVSHVSETDGSSGVAVIVVDENAQNSIVVIPGANALVTPADLDTGVEVIRQAGMVLAQLEVPIETILYLAKLCRSVCVPLMLDPAPARKVPVELLQELAWFTPNETEAAFYLEKKGGDPATFPPEATAQHLAQRGLQGVLLKMGSRGVYVSGPSISSALVPAFPVKPVDTTAAGDCFNGAFATGLMLGKSPMESARFAAAAAAISVTRHGAQPSMPTLPEVEAMLAGFQTS